MQIIRGQTGDNGQSLLSSGHPLYFPRHPLPWSLHFSFSVYFHLYVSLRSHQGVISLSLCFLLFLYSSWSGDFDSEASLNVTPLIPALPQANPLVLFP